MDKNYVKEKKIIDQSKIEKENELKASIMASKRNLMNMHNNLNLAEGELVDYYIYMIKAEEAKYDYLIRKVKNSELS